MAKTVKTTKTPKAPKKTKTKVAEPQVPIQKTIPTATKAYVFDKMDKLPVTQIAEDTGLTTGEIEKLILSKELDKRPEDGNQAPLNVRRYDISGDKYAQTVSLSPAQARLNDIATKENAANQLENLKKAMGPDLQIITLNPK